MKVLCIGDSITWGAWDVDGGWVGRVRRRFDQRWLASLEPGATACSDSAPGLGGAGGTELVLTYNLGISSDTSTRVLERLPSAIAACSQEEGELAFILSLGTNDSIWSTVDKRHWVSIEQFEANMSKIVEMALEHSDKVLLLGSAGIDEAKTHPYGWAPDIESSNADIQRYDEVSHGVATSVSIPFVPVFEEFMANDPLSMLSGDGVHPNATGHQFIADLVWPHVDRWCS